MSKQVKIEWPVVFSAAGRADWPNPTIVDMFLHPAFGGNNLGQYGKQTLEEMRAEYPDAVMMDQDSAYNAYNNAFRKPPTRITKDRFWYALEVLPPCRWVNDGHWETFYVSERVAGDVVSIYCRIGTNYFELQDVYTLLHGEILHKCREFMNKEKQTAAGVTP